MENCVKSEWIERFMEMARLTATWSKDPDHKVGSVLVDHERRVIGIGFNGFPRGVRDLPERLASKHLKRMMIVHAEANAILNSRSSFVDCTLFATRHPCTECVKLIIQSGISVVHCPQLEVGSSWEEDSVVASCMMREAGVAINIYVQPPSLVMENVTIIRTP